MLCFFLFIPQFILAGVTESESRVPKSDLIFEPIEGADELPNVLIIGDSISMGYTLPVRLLLKGIANLDRIPTNGGSTNKGISEIEYWLGEKQWDLIHFNWGLHDLKYMGNDGTNHVLKEKGGIVQVPLADYEKNLEKICSPDEKIGQSIGLAEHHSHSSLFQGPFRG